jgi:NhaA family Na+:H+ antiporter
MQGFKGGADAFLHHEAAGGIVLLAAAVVALLLSNSSLAWAYGALLSTPASLSIGVFIIEKPLLLWINDGLTRVSQRV